MNSTNFPKVSATDATCLMWGTAGVSELAQHLPLILSTALTFLGICWYTIQIYQWIRSKIKKPNG